MQLMLKKYLLSTAIFSLVFLFNTSTIRAEETSVSDVTTTTPTLDNRMDIKAQRLEELKAKQAIRMQEVERKKTEIVAKKQERSVRLESEKAERALNIEELKAKQEQFKQNRETLRATFDEMKLQKLGNIKQRGLLVSARYTAISEAMYKMLGRVNTIVSEKKKAGFDVSSAEDSLTAIELKLANIKGQEESIQALIDDLENLSPEEIPSSLTEIKNLSTALKSQYETVRNDIKQLVQTLK